MFVVVEKESCGLRKNTLLLFSVLDHNQPASTFKFIKSVCLEGTKKKKKNKKA